jgi:hypothetical protein
VRTADAMHIRRALAVGLGLALILVSATPAAAKPRVAAGSAPAAAKPKPRASASAPAAVKPKPRAPSGPPLVSGSGSAGSAGAEEASLAQEPVDDPLVANGLGSPLCHEQSGAGALGARALRNCRTSGFAAAAAPTSSYAFDINLSGGLLGLDPTSLFQKYMLAPVWMGLVWIVHALLAMIEWSYTIDLIDGPAASGLGRGLRETQAAFTQPWLVFALAVASMLVAYHGLLRRRVAATVGEVLVMAAMMAGGLWTIADPGGTVGALGAWVNQSSLGALSALAQGTPSGGAGALTDGTSELFAEGIQAPWCYLEFGNVRWCREPAQLDPRLHADGLRLAARKQPGSPPGQEYGDSAELLREARSNGELFLAFPANGPLRNSTGKSEDLLSVLCGGADIGSCNGSTAGEAEFRSAGGTEPRAAGLLLILVGLGGMVLVLGFLALRLLAAALTSLFYLLLAPAAVLAPAFGDGGREAFRLWATHLTGAVLAKFVYSIFLGAALAMVRILLDLPGIGWWPQWLLVCAVWWGAFAHRRKVLGVFEWRYRELAREWLRERRLREW